MSTQPQRVCAFCPELEENEEIGYLLRSPDGKIVAHSNCMLFSPLVVSKDTYSQDFFGELNVESVKNEIQRSRKLRCSYCRAKGASIGCDNRTCRRSYHYLCVKKANGKYVCDPEREIYIVFCSEHKDTEQETNANNGHSPLGRRRQKKRRRLEMTHTARKWISTSDSDTDVLILVDSNDSKNTVKVSRRHPPESQSINQKEPKPGKPGSHGLQPALRQQSTQTHLKAETQTHPACIKPAAASAESDGDGEMQVEPNLETTVVERSAVSRRRCPESQSINQKEPKPKKLSESPEQLKEALHPAPHKGTSGSDSEASDSLLSPNIKWAISLSGLPLKDRKRVPKRTTNTQLEEKLLTMCSEERKICEQMYTDLGGSFPSVSQEECPTQDYRKTETDFNEVDEAQTTTAAGNPDPRRGNSRQHTSKRYSSDVGQTTINQPQRGPQVVGGNQAGNPGLKRCDGHCLCYNRLEEKIDSLLKVQERLKSSLEAQEKMIHLVHQYVLRASGKSVARS